MNMVDLRSDTVTLPSPAMRQAMMEAELGDDVLGDDPTVRQLEAHAIAITGKAAAVFVPSGTMANQIAIRLHTRPGDAVIMEAGAHPFHYESGGMAAISGVQAILVAGTYGLLDPVDVTSALRPNADWIAPIRLLCVEDTANAGGGTVYPLDTLDALTELARTHTLRTHFDGARAFNAVVASGIPLDRRVRDYDTVTFCLSKGLGAPAGSVLCGSVDDIKVARRVRKMLGGAMRQAGILAGAGLYALKHNIASLAEDHRRLSAIATAWQHNGYDIVPPQTNILYVDAPDATELTAKLEAQGVRCIATRATRLRMVTHRDINDDGLAIVIRAIAGLARGPMG